MYSKTREKLSIKTFMAAEFRTETRVYQIPSICVYYIPPTTYNTQK